MRLAAALCLALLATPALTQHATGQTAPGPSATDLEVRQVARGLEHPWGLAFLPDGRMLVTERPGRLRMITAEGRVSPALAGTPPVHAVGQGGLLGIAIDPAFAQNRFVYLSFAEPRGNGANATAVFRGRLNAAGTGLESGRVIWRQQPAFVSRHHFGSRLVFDRSGHLYVTTGDRFQQAMEAQNPANTIAKVVRITRDGEPAPGNPGGSWEPTVYAIGLRNPQGAALHPQTGELWISNHGPRGGDGLYPIRPGKNYGWPLISWGTHYDGRPVNNGLREREGLEQPSVHWTPSIAPSGLAFYTADLFPAWRGSLFSGALAGQMLVRMELDGDRVMRQERLLTDLGKRFRDVHQGPDGALWLLTDAADGELLRLAPRGR